MRGILRGFGLKMGVVTRTGYDARVRERSAGQAMLERIIGAMLEARAALWREFTARWSGLSATMRLTGG